ncbi:MAG TPA: hypothetical protein VGW11_03895 [Solirubrobacteraceae bacterium]|nr:hypothetical protein [Solirubrobacteraceae bacterium]
MPNRRPSFRVVAPSASPQEAAAIAAALEQFFRATAPSPAAAEPRPDLWARRHLLESVHREPPQLGVWGGDSHRWGW